LGLGVLDGDDDDDDGMGWERFVSDFITCPFCL